MDPQREPESRKNRFFNDVFASTISNRFFIDFSCQLAPLETQKSLIFHLFFKAFSKNRLLKLTSISDTILMPTWLHFGLPNRLKFYKNQSQKQSFFWSISASIFDPFWVHFGSQVGVMLAFKIHWKSIKNRSGTVLVPPKPPGSPQSLPGTDFRVIFDRFFNDFWWFFQWFAIEFCFLFSNFIV